MITDLIRWFNINIKFRYKLCIVFTSLVIMVIIATSMVYYNITLNTVEEITTESVFNSLVKNNDSIDEVFWEVMKSLDRLNKDEDLYNILANIDETDSKSIIMADREVQRIFPKYFDSTYIKSPVLLTSKYSLGVNKWAYREWVSTDINDKIIKANGKIVWVPTFNFIEMLDQQYLGGEDFDHRYLFSCAKLLSPTSDNRRWPREKERPVALISFNSDFYKRFFDNNIPVKNTGYIVIDEDANVIYNNGIYESIKEDREFIQELINGKQSGVEGFTVEGTRMLICYDKSNVTGWTTVALIDENSLMKEMKNKIYWHSILFSIVAVVVVSIISFFIGKLVTKPISKLTNAFERTENGEFGITVETGQGNDIDYILGRFNSMSQQVDRLITENYERQLLEKEATIKALNVQLNPHFLYNTLNLINCIAIENQQMDISSILVSLSRMLRYTAENEREFGILEEEISWLKQYCSIMELRFKGEITTIYDIDERLLDAVVPKLFLQPFIENAFIHGFKNKGFIVKVSANIEKDKRVFRVINNGERMSKAFIDKINNGIYSDKSIGMKNVNERIVLIYGKEYSINVGVGELGGAEIIIKLPL